MRSIQELPRSNSGKGPYGTGGYPVESLEDIPCLSRLCESRKVVPTP
jgi:hypothetical protein